MLPKDWQLVTVGECADLLTGHAFNSQGYVEPSESTVKLLRGDNIGQGSLRWIDAKHWPTPYTEQLQRYEMRKGDIVIAMDRPIVNAGLKCCVVEHHDLPSLLVQRVARLRAKQHFNQDYLAHVFQTHRFIEHLKGQKTETAVPHISPHDIRAFEFPCPLNPDEQRRIAQILSTWDRAIATTEQLLANSQRRTRDLTASLLSGRRRFPGMSDKWRYVDFDSVFERVTRKNTTHDTNVLTISAEYGLISQRDYFNKSVASANLGGYTLLHRYDFAYNKSYSAGYPMGAIKPLLAYEAGVVSSLYLCFKLQVDVDADFDFFRHYFEAGLLNQQIEGIAQEGARNHGLLNVSVKDFFKLQLHIPTAREQRRIAEIINIAEAEEAGLEAQLRSLRQEKAALMSQLLTGKSRVKLLESETELQP
ncbi:type I restriction enzyme S subunit [Paraburkholderia sp. CI2]|uniref:restriction endonuclease subunit S n=1 Tax=Paraburkholderia sp. CI2 TaxID=2723093 RepID=UPI00160A77C5|nr:restriction endonuclease subunit S [Paraburkholderia sp. CI2]MBB5469392.1 type I restriction enzyme S subunit [Paraburkholderia sp. CI2]